MRFPLSTVLLLLFISNIALCQTTDEKKRVIEILDRFEQAIVNNDRETASELLADEIRILEGSTIETKDEYLSHHFHADGKFLSAMERTIESQKVFIKENTAWATTKSQLQGEYNDQSVNLSSLELAVLTKENGHWKIKALHWSSSTRD